MHISSISALILDILAIYSPIWLCLRQDAAVGLRSYTYYADGPIIANYMFLCLQKMRISLTQALIFDIAAVYCPDMLCFSMMFLKLSSTLHIGLMAF